MWGKIAKVATRSVPILGSIVTAATLIVEIASVVERVKRK